MKRLFKQACSALALLLCCGCMATSASGKSTGALPKATADRIAVATGRFVEADVTPPQMDRTMPMAVLPQADGSVDLFLVENGLPLRLCSRDGTGWEQETPAWAKAAVEKYGGKCVFSCAAMTESGLCHVALTGADGKAHLLEARQDGTFREIPVPAWEAGGFTVKTVTALENGDFGFTYEGRDAEVIDGKTGGSKMVFGGTDGVFTEKQFAASEKESVVFYDLATGKRLNAVGVAGGRGGTALAADHNGAVYIASQSGIGRMPAGGSVFETIVESGLYSFAGADCSIEALTRQPGADVFYLLLKRQGRPAIYRYTYTADAPARPGTQLNVFSMEDSGTVRRAMIELQRENPNVTVRYQVGAESQLSREETMRALENELKNGKGPDVLILDGLDSAVYEHLADVGELEGLAACFPNIMDAGVRDGKRYAVPTRFILPVKVGEAGEIARYGPDGNGQPATSVVRGTPSGQEGLHVLISLCWNRSISNAPGDAASNYRELDISAAGTLQPAVFAGINANGNQELARQLIVRMLSGFVQQGDFEEGFPVRMDSFDEIIKEEVKNEDINIVTDMKAMCLSQKVPNGPPEKATVDSVHDLWRGKRD